MALKTYKPTSPGRRQLVLVDRSELHKGRPVKMLTEGLTKTGGRNNKGRMTGAPQRRSQPSVFIARSTLSGRVGMCQRPLSAWNMIRTAPRSSR